MALSVVKIEKTSKTKVTVLLGSVNRAELNSDGGTKQFAIEAAQPHLGRAGFDKLGSCGYIPPGGSEPLSVAEMLLPNKIVPGSGLWVQEYIIAGFH